MTTEPIYDLSIVNDVLSKWNGASAKIWQFHPSLGRLAIQIYRTSEPEQLYLIYVSCRNISGPFHWRDCEIRVIKEKRDPDEDLATHLVEDHAAGFALRCSSVVVVLSTMADFDLYDNE